MTYNPFKKTQEERDKLKKLKKHVNNDKFAKSIAAPYFAYLATKPTSNPNHNRFSNNNKSYYKPKEKI